MRAYIIFRSPNDAVLAEHYLAQDGINPKLCNRPASLGRGCGASIVGERQQVIDMVKLIQGRFSYPLQIYEH